jgi:hypothetical protein
VKTKLLSWCSALRGFLAVPAFAFVFCVTATARADIRADTLEAIHLVENPRDLTRAGPAGELGAYQFRRETWAMHTRRPFREALIRACSDEVAVAHYEWLRAGLKRNGLEVTPYNIALAWNAGLTAVVKGRAPRTAQFYAERVTNLASEMATRVGELSDKRSGGGARLARRANEMAV